MKDGYLVVTLFQINGSLPFFLNTFLSFILYNIFFTNLTVTILEFNHKWISIVSVRVWIIKSSLASKGAVAAVREEYCIA